jgi:putative transport protein
VGYGISYPISLLFIVLFVQLVPRLFHKDIVALNKELAEQRPVHPQITQAMIELANPAIMGKTLADLKFVPASNCGVVRVLEGERLVPAAPELLCRPDTHVVVIGTADGLAAVTDYLGQPSARQGP